MYRISNNKGSLLFLQTSADNPIFYPIEFIIKMLRKPGSYFYVPAIFSFAWYGMKLPFDFTYYSFYGSHIDLATGNQDQSAIILLPDRPVAALSESQVNILHFI